MSPAEKLRLMESFDVRKAVMSIVDSKDFLMEVTDLNRDQWEQGLNSKGEKIGEYESDDYAAMKYSENSRAGRGYVDLMLTHALERAMYARVSGDTIEIDSEDWKSEFLQERYVKKFTG